MRRVVILTIYACVVWLGTMNTYSFAEESLIDVYRGHKQSLIKADVRAEQGLYLEAVELYKLALRQFTQFKKEHQGWSSMILVDIQISRCEDKITELQELIKRTEIFRERYQKSEPVLTPDETPNESSKISENFDRQLRRADALLANQEYQRALVHLNKALEIVPDNPYARLSKGVALFKLKNVVQSIEVLESLIKDYPKFPAARYNMADIYYSLGDLDKAVLFYQEAVSMDDKDLRSRVNLGVIYVKQKRYNKALDLFVYVLKRNDTLVDAHYNLGIIYSDYLFDRDKAIFHYSKYLECYPGAPDAREVSQWIKDLEQGRTYSYEVAKS